MNYTFKLKTSISQKALENNKMISQKLGSRWLPRNNSYQSLDKRTELMSR